MKHLWFILLLVLAMLCGCGSAAPAADKAPEGAAAAPEATAQVKQSAVRVITDDGSAGAAPSSAAAAPAETAAPTEAPKQSAAAEPDANSPMQIAQTFVGASPEDLYAAIGYPESSDYASSCLGSGEDGNLYYDGFTVYTYREDGVETIRYVE